MSSTGFIDKLAIARDSFEDAKGRVNLGPLKRVLYNKEYMRLNVNTGKRAYFNDLPEGWEKDCNKDGELILWYGVEELYRQLGGFMKD